GITMGSRITTRHAVTFISAADDDLSLSGGYKSGRIRCRGIPLSSSHLRTCSGGTLLRRTHFWTACTDRSMSRANAVSPSSRSPFVSRESPRRCRAASMISATILGSGVLERDRSLRGFRLMMPPNLQPIVAIGQQLIRAAGLHTLQPMRALTKDQVRNAFSARLNELLDELGAPSRGRAQWLSDQFKGQFSREAARKWLEAETMPDETHKAMLCTMYGWSSDYLVTGIGPKYAGRIDP